MKMFINDQTDIQHYTLLESMPRYCEIRKAISDTTDKDIIFDLSKVKFAYPLFLNMLLLLRDGSTKKISFESPTSYLATVTFPQTTSITAIDIFKDSKGTYLPMISDKPETIDKYPESLARILSEKAAQQAGISTQVKQGMAYVLQEIIDNVNQHAQATRLYASIQSYPSRKFTDICIADNGAGITQSYRRAGISIRDDTEAMKNVASALSSKDRPDNESRGYGLFTSRKIATEGLNGEFLCASGNAIFSKFKDKTYLMAIDKTSDKEPFIKGTVIALRLYYDNEKFNLYNYLEY